MPRGLRTGLLVTLALVALTLVICAVWRSHQPEYEPQPESVAMEFLEKADSLQTVAGHSEEKKGAVKKKRRKSKSSKSAKKSERKERKEKKKLDELPRAGEER